jgi:hypothetical protein
VGGGEIEVHRDFSFEEHGEVVDQAAFSRR